MTLYCGGGQHTRMILFYLIFCTNNIWGLNELAIRTEHNTHPKSREFRAGIRLHANARFIWTNRPTRLLKLDSGSGSFGQLSSSGFIYNHLLLAALSKAEKRGCSLSLFIQRALSLRVHHGLFNRYSELCWDLR